LRFSEKENQEIFLEKKNPTMGRKFGISISLSPLTAKNYNSPSRKKRPILRTIFKRAYPKGLYSEI